ncbi:MAG: carboxypeptidase regulatory-like domain-containing protein [bacterium]
MQRLTALICLAGFVSVARAQTPAAASHRYAGFVSDSSGAAVGYAEIRLTPYKKEIHETHTDATGHFVITGLPTGAAQLHVRRLGFHPFNGTITIGTEAPDTAHLVLYVASAELAAIEVREESFGDSLAPREFWIRKKTNPAGRYLDHDAIDAKHVNYASELFRDLPGVTITRPNNRIGMILRIRGCKPTIWVDGVRAGGAEIDEIMSVNDIGAIEIYNSVAGMPPQYVDRNNTCGGILFWTRSR